MSLEDLFTPLLDSLMLGLLLFDVLGPQLLGVLLHSTTFGPLMLEPSPSQVRVSLSLSSIRKKKQVHVISLLHSIQCMFEHDYDTLCIVLYIFINVFCMYNQEGTLYLTNNDIQAQLPVPCTMDVVGVGGRLITGVANVLSVSSSTIIGIIHIVTCSKSFILFGLY